MSGSINSTEGELNAIIKEYLESSKLDSALHAFEDECRKKGKPIQEHAGVQDERIFKVQRELVHHFNEGRQLEFFTFWESQINPDVIDQDTYSQKLEFMLHVHFAVHPLRKTDHWVQEDAEQSMYQFRYYLENRGVNLSCCSELLPFFALPYVQQPSSHPSFSHVFLDTWVLELKNKLEAFLWENLKNRLTDDATVPRLVDLYNHNDVDLKEAKNEVRLLERRLEDSQKCYVHQSKKLDKLQADCQQLMSTASLLVTALESAVKGDIVDLDCVLSSCAERFPVAYKLKSNDSVLEGNEKDKANIANSNLNLGEKISKIIPPLDFPLDFPKIQKEISCVDGERSQQLLLQALRWRLTRGGSWIHSVREISNFIKNDILSLRDVPSQQPTFLNIMRTFNVVLRQSISRLLNAFASFSQGREYLSRCPELLHALMDNLLVFKSKDNVIRDMTLGTLQKLSMRSVCQIIMVEAGMMEWLAETLQQPKKLSDYSLEYSVALLMNLCLCPTGKTRCEPIKETLLLLLKDLLLLNNRHVIGYVNGALYSLLSSSNIKSFALQQNLDDALSSVMSNSDPEVKKQLECIQELLHSEGDNNSCSSADDTEDEEDTELEPELDRDDPVCALPDEASGEVLLWNIYSLSNFDESPLSHALDDKLRRDKMLKNNCSFNDLSPRRNIQCNGLAMGHNASMLRSNSVPPITANPPGLSLLLQSPSKAYPVSEPVTPKLDLVATQLVRKIVGKPSTTLVEAAIQPHPSSVHIKGLNVNEYICAFSSRPKIPRTPELSASGSKRSRNQVSPSPNMDALCLASWESESLMEQSPRHSVGSPTFSHRGPDF